MFHERIFQPGFLFRRIWNRNPTRPRHGLESRSRFDAAHDQNPSSDKGRAANALAAVNTNTLSVIERFAHFCQQRGGSGKRLGNGAVEDRKRDEAYVVRFGQRSFLGGAPVRPAPRVREATRPFLYPRFASPESRPQASRLRAAGRESRVGPSKVPELDTSWPRFRLLHDILPQPCLLSSDF